MRAGKVLFRALLLAAALAGPFAAPAAAGDLGTDESPPQEITAPELPAEMREGVTLVAQIFRMVAFLGGLAALGYLAVRVLGPRLSPVSRDKTDLIRVIDMKRLDPKTALYIVEVGEKHALIAVSDKEVRCLSNLDLDDEVIRGRVARRDAGSAEKVPSAFAKVLARSAGKGG